MHLVCALLQPSHPSVCPNFSNTLFVNFILRPLDSSLAGPTASGSSTCGCPNRMAMGISMPGLLGSGRAGVPTISLINAASHFSSSDLRFMAQALTTPCLVPASTSLASRTCPNQMPSSQGLLNFPRSCFGSFNLLYHTFPAKGTTGILHDLPLRRSYSLLQSFPAWYLEC